MNGWDNIRVFLAVAEEGSLSAGGRRLKMSQPTVGRRIESLESRLGATLFLRESRGLTLTESGQAVLEHARVMEREWFGAERAAESASQGLTGDVTLSVAEGIGTEWLPRVLGEFHQRFPDIVVHVIVESRTANIVRREADIALRFGGPGGQATTVARRVARVGFGFYASTAYVARRGEPETPAALADHDTVWANFGGGAIWPAELEGRGLSPGRVTFHTNSPAAHLRAVGAGFGIGVLSHRWAAQNPDLVRVLPDIPALMLDLWLVTHRELKTSARLRAMFDFLVETLARDAAHIEAGAPLEDGNASVASHVDQTTHDSKRKETRR